MARLTLQKSCLMGAGACRPDPDPPWLFPSIIFQPPMLLVMRNGPPRNAIGRP
uniref:Uncharacterized protein n=1 Tax=Aegilops tauschii TaxID=37682 RepID=R7W667_AEGTA